jgi:hypothetical protein
MHTYNSSMGTIQLDNQVSECQLTIVRGSRDVVSDEMMMKSRSERLTVFIELSVFETIRRIYFDFG